MLKKNEEISLVRALQYCKNDDIMAKFLHDLLTPKEMLDLQDRWKVCQMLVYNNFTYREISQKTKVSLATIVRVARFLNVKNSGYMQLIQKIIGEKNENNIS